MGASPKSAEIQAAALWAYFNTRLPRFSPQAAVDIVARLPPKLGDNPKILAKRLREAMAAHGVRIKHAAALEAASRLCGYDNWHTANRTLNAPRLKLMPISVTGSMADMFTTPEKQFESWHDLIEPMCRYCDARLQAISTKILQVHFALTYAMIGTPARREGEHGGVIQLEPLLGISPIAGEDDWLDGAASAFEALRRHLEEQGVAVLDGISALQLLHKYDDRESLSYGFPGVRVADVCNSELVLMREDNDLAPNSGYEIARGDEMTCWAQLELAMKDHSNKEVRLDGDAWRIGNGRYVWDLVTLHPGDYYPRLTNRRLNKEDSGRLFRRYQLANRTLSGQVKYHEVNKTLAYLTSPMETYRVDLHRVLLALAKVGHTWESICNLLEAEQELVPELPMGIVISLVEQLKMKNPNDIFARPSRAEMVRIDDDTILRALLPRVDTIRFQLGAFVPEHAKPTIREAVEDLADSLRVRNLTASGTLFSHISSDDQLPQLVYGQDGEELRLKLEELGLILYASVLPHLFPMEGMSERLPAMENVAPYAFGNSLYLLIEALDDGKAGSADRSPL
ncbi:glyoxalase superfamily protein [Cupriavidus sp. amp6]|uniref:glyoxalase superfamily protein n=1 Tax=Cupriavidus sp. amp6 TaxID=388051 RepID=UPI0003F63155|nr:glyoxalase superfamily protein [Cupriavidus sp. amp6]